MRATQNGATVLLPEIEDTASMQQSPIWKPVTAAELEHIVHTQLAACTPEQRQTFNSCRVPFHQVPILRDNSIEHVFVVAQLLDGSLVCYEDVEDGFEIVRLDSEGVISDYACNQFELRQVLNEYAHSRSR